MAFQSKELYVSVDYLIIFCSYYLLLGGKANSSWKTLLLCGWECMKLYDKY